MFGTNNDSSNSSNNNNTPPPQQQRHQHQNDHARPKYMCICIKCTFFAHWPAFSPLATEYSRALGCGARRGPPVHFPQLRAPDGLRRARSGRSKSRELASNQGIDFRLAVPRRTWETPRFNIFAHRPSSSLLGGSHGTTAVAHQALPFMTAWTVHLCVRVCAAMVFVPVDLGNRNEHTFPREVP